MGPHIFHSLGKPWILAYSSTLKGRSSVGWQRSVAGIVGLVTKVGDGRLKLNLRKKPVFPPPNFNLAPIASFCISGGRFFQY